MSGRGRRNRECRSIGVLVHHDSGNAVANPSSTLRQPSTFGSSYSVAAAATASAGNVSGSRTASRSTTARAAVTASASPPGASMWRYAGAPSRVAMSGTTATSYASSARFTTCHVARRSGVSVATPVSLDTMSPLGTDSARTRSATRGSGSSSAGSTGASNRRRHPVLSRTRSANHPSGTMNEKPAVPSPHVEPPPTSDAASGATLGAGDDEGATVAVGSATALLEGEAALDGGKGPVLGSDPDGGPICASPIPTPTATMMTAAAASQGAAVRQRGSRSSGASSTPGGSASSANVAAAARSRASNCSSSRRSRSVIARFPRAAWRAGAGRETGWIVRSPARCPPALRPHRFGIRGRSAAR